MADDPVIHLNIKGDQRPPVEIALQQCLQAQTAAIGAEHQFDAASGVGKGRVLRREGGVLLVRQATKADGTVFVADLRRSVGHGADLFKTQFHLTGSGCGWRSRG